MPRRPRTSTLKPIDQNLGPDGEPIVLADDEAAALVVVKLELTYRGSFGGLGIWRFDEAEKLAPAMAAPATQSVRQPGLCHYRGCTQYAR
jgi:hypothetical protein